MKTLFFCLLFLASCGKNTSHKSLKEENTSEINTKASLDEAQLIKYFLEEKTLPEKEVYKKLLSLKTLNEEVLTSLDRKLDIHCLNGICRIQRKN